MLDRKLQKEIQLELRKAYPDVANTDSFLDVNEKANQMNLYYLAEHGLIEPGAQRRSMKGSPQILTAQITADGLDLS